MSSHRAVWLRQALAAAYTYGDPNLMNVVGLNRSVAYDFLVEPWQRHDIFDRLFVPLGLLLCIAVLQISLCLVLVLPLRFIGETSLNVWRYYRSFNGPEPRDPSRSRRRKLSIDDHTGFAETLIGILGMQGQNKTQNSLFLTKLPLEIRLQIYRLVLGDRYFQILVLASGPYKLTGTFRRHAYIQCESYDCPHPIHRDPSIQTFCCEYTRDVMPTLLVCRQMYREAIDILYCENTFKFREHRYVHMFLKSLLPQRRRMIRKMTVDVNSHRLREVLSTSQCDSIDLSGLRHLYIYVSLNYWCHDTTNLSELLKIGLPQNMRDLIIAVPVDFPVPDNGFEMNGGGGYTLIRKSQKYDCFHGI